MAKNKKLYIVRGKLLALDGPRCHYCQLITSLEHKPAHPRYTTVDHKEPRSRGGTWALTNLVIACRRCNLEKASIPYDMYLWFRHMLMRGEEREDLLAAIGIVLSEPVRSEGLGHEATA